MNTFKLLQKLSETAGPSGQETAVAAVVEELWQPYVDEFRRDLVGNLIAVRHGSGPEPRRRILLAAHMDEIALMVSEVVSHNGHGFLRVTSVGGVDKRHLYGQLVTVHGRKPLHGVIGNLPAFMLPPEKRNKPFDFETLVVDVGLPLAEVEELVDVGDFVSFRQPLRKLLNGRAAGKALDNRASVAAVTICLKELNKRQHSWDVIAVATSQEETRLLGAFTSAHSQQPDAAVAIDVTFAVGPGAGAEDAFALNGGPVLDIGPNVNPGMYRALKKAADRLEMKTGTDTHGRGSGTDAFGLQIARTGIPTGLVSIPLRYMHTMVETIALKDIKRSGRLLAEFIAGLDEEFLDKIAQEMMES